MRVLTVHHELSSSLGTLEPAIGARGHQHDHWHPWRGDPAPAAGAHGAVVVLGGVANVGESERYPWLVAERTLLHGLVQHGTPLLGICLGGQLLASVLDAPVTRLPDHELGWYDVELLPEAARDPLLAGFPDRFPAFQWHDYGFALPPGAIALATSQRAPSQAYRYGDHVWGLQFHIEVDRAIIEHWIVGGHEEMARKGVSGEALRAESDRLLPDYVALADGLMHRFLAVAEAAASARAA